MLRKIFILWTNRNQIFPIETSTKYWINLWSKLIQRYKNHRRGIKSFLPLQSIKFADTRLRFDIFFLFQRRPFTPNRTVFHASFPSLFFLLFYFSIQLETWPISWPAIRSTIAQKSGVGEIDEPSVGGRSYCKHEGLTISPEKRGLKVDAIAHSAIDRRRFEPGKISLGCVKHCIACKLSN